MRQRLAEATIDLAKKRGVRGSTVDDVAARVDVSRRTFFNYFWSKEEAPIDSAA